MTVHPRSAARLGISLAEMLVAMTCASAVVAAATTLLHRTMTLESASRRVCERERSALTLARQFRLDVHQATKIACSDDGLAAPAVLRLETAAGATVEYETTRLGLARIERAPAATASREDWRLASGMAWSSARRGELISLVGRGGEAGAGPPPIFEALAVRGRRLAAAGEGARP